MTSGKTYDRKLFLSHFVSIMSLMILLWQPIFDGIAMTVDESGLLFIPTEEIIPIFEYHCRKHIEEKEFDKACQEAFMKLLIEEANNSQKLKLNKQLDPRLQKDGEALGEYYIDLLQLAGRIKDERVIPALVNSVESGRGVWNSLSQFGDKAVTPLMMKFSGLEKNDYMRDDCIDALGVLYSSENISEESRHKIEEVLQTSLQDDNKAVRDAAKAVLEKTP